MRRATVADADAIGHVHVAAWQAAYRGLMDDGFLDRLDPATRSVWWRERLADQEDGLEVLVAVEGGAVQGFVLVGAAADEEHAGDPRVGQVHGLNVRPEVWGRRRGDLLLAAGEAALVRRGAERALLWVVAGNTRARRLYERRGWSADGGVRTAAFGPSSVEEVRYSRVLTD